MMNTILANDKFATLNYNDVEELCNSINGHLTITWNCGCTGIALYFHPQPSHPILLGTLSVKTVREIYASGLMDVEHNLRHSLEAMDLL